MSAELLKILNEINEILETSGAFKEFDCAPEECGLPTVYGLLDRAIAIVRSSELRTDNSKYGSGDNPLLH